MRQRRPRIKDNARLQKIRELSCVVCGTTSTIEAAHVSYAEPLAGKRGRGLGEKTDDQFTVPLCRYCHIQSHEWGNERQWWKIKGFEESLVWLALALTVARDHAHREEIVSEWRQRALASR